MRALACLSALICLGALAPAARAGDWSLQIGIGVPGVVYAAPGPVYASPPVYYSPPPAVYYRPPYYGYYHPRYYPPAYYRAPVVGYYGYADHHRRYHERGHDDDGD
jgi:hypothetical protein